MMGVGGARSFLFRKTNKVIIGACHVFGQRLIVMNMRYEGIALFAVVRVSRGVSSP